jgi:hypothetical protein
MWFMSAIFLPPKERDVLLVRAKDVLAGKAPVSTPSGGPTKY